VKLNSAILTHTNGSIAVYTNGDECWNGPARVVHVAFVCGLQNKITNVAENGKCRYEMIFQTPFACDGEYGREILEMLEEPKVI
jgi:protein kinase C substrate 80K-H